MSEIVCVTGAGGFLGAEIVRQALDLGFAVRGVGSRGCAVLGAQSRECDLRDLAATTEALQGARYVIHAAGLAHVRAGGRETRQALWEGNVVAAASSARAAVAVNAARFLLVSSSSVYGHHPEGPINENTSCRPLSDYARSKVDGEVAVNEALVGTHVSVTILRLCTLIGEGDKGNVRRLIAALKSGRFFWVGTGKNRKSLLHKEDAARAALMASLSEDTGGRVLNVTPNVATTKEIVGWLAEQLGVQVPGWHIPGSVARAAARAFRGVGAWVPLATPYGLSLQGWLSDELLDGDEFHRIAGFTPRISIREGLQREVAWCCATGGAAPR